MTDKHIYEVKHRHGSSSTWEAIMQAYCLGEALAKVRELEGEGREAAIVNSDTLHLVYKTAPRPSALVEAAPDLLIACRALNTLCCEHAFSTTELEAVLDLARAAIVKAEG